MRLREVSLPEYVPGQLFLSHMPGRNEGFKEAQEVIRDFQVHTVVCLNSLNEIALKSPEYAKAINNNRLDFDWEHFPLFDFGVPNDITAFVSLTNSLADRLRNGERILVHCAGGIGRTATLAVSILMNFGIGIETAESIIREAGAMVQSRAQKELIIWLKDTINGG